MLDYTENPLGLWHRLSRARRWAAEPSVAINIHPVQKWRIALGCLCHAGNARPLNTQRYVVQNHAYLAAYDRIGGCSDKYIRQMKTPELTVREQSNQHVCPAINREIAVTLSSMILLNTARNIFSKYNKLTAWADQHPAKSQSIHSPKAL